MPLPCHCHATRVSSTRSRFFCFSSCPFRLLRRRETKSGSCSRPDGAVEPLQHRPEPRVPPRFRTGENLLFFYPSSRSGLIRPDQKHTTDRKPSMGLMTPPNETDGWFRARKLPLRFAFAFRSCSLSQARHKTNVTDPPHLQPADLC